MQIVIIANVTIDISLFWENCKHNQQQTELVLSPTMGPLSPLLLAEMRWPVLHTTKLCRTSSPNYKEPSWHERCDMYLSSEQWKKDREMAFFRLCRHLLACWQPNRGKSAQTTRSLEYILNHCRARDGCYCGAVEEVGSRCGSVSCSGFSSNKGLIHLLFAKALP